MKTSRFSKSATVRLLSAGMLSVLLLFTSMTAKAVTGSMDIGGQASVSLVAYNNGALTTDDAGTNGDLTGNRPSAAALWASRAISPCFSKPVLLEYRKVAEGSKEKLNHFINFYTINQDETNANF